jgi:hypothetical protein
MALDIVAPTVELFVPNLGKVVAVNAADAAYIRATAGAVSKAEYEAAQAPATSAGKPFKTKAEKEAAEKEAAEKAAAEKAAAEKAAAGATT